MPYVLDAHGLLAFLEKEKGYARVRDLLAEAVEKEEPLLMTTVNWGEVYYIILRECGKQMAERIEKTVLALPIELTPVDQSLAREAAKLKARKKMSYADCVAAALAKIHSAAVVTGDPEFKQVSDEIDIIWC